MLSKQEEDRELHQWGILLNMVKQRKKLSEIHPHSTTSKIILNIVHRLENQIHQIIDSE